MRWMTLSLLNSLPLPQAEKQSLYKIEASYSDCLGVAERAMDQFRSRINQGRLVARFGSRAAELLQKVQQAFLEKTAGALVVYDRMDRYRQLSQYMRIALNGLYLKQLEIASGEAAVTLKKELLRQMGARGDDLPTEDIQQAVRNQVFRFQVVCGELEGASSRDGAAGSALEQLGFDSTSAVQELTATLQAVAKEFPESSAAKILALNRLDQRVRRPMRGKGKAKRGKRALQIGLNLVGMLRPPGYGNLQGFVGYNALSFLGVPLDLLLGVQNDGDAPEVRTGMQREECGVVWLEGARPLPMAPSCFKTTALLVSHVVG